MLRPETRRALDAYWAGVFGCAADGLRPAAPSVLPRGAGDESRGAYAMEFGAAPVALLPGGSMDRHAARVAELLSAGLVGDAARRGAAEAALGVHAAGGLEDLVSALVRHGRGISGKQMCKQVGTCIRTTSLQLSGPSALGDAGSS